MGGVLDDFGDILTVVEMMSVLRIGKNTAYGLLRDGAIRSYKIGKYYRIPKKCIRDFLDQMERGCLNEE